jgi:hypothetical protein
LPPLTTGSIDNAVIPYGVVRPRWCKAAVRRVGAGAPQEQADADVRRLMHSICRLLLRQPIARRGGILAPFQDEPKAFP